MRPSTILLKSRVKDCDFKASKRDKDGDELVGTSDSLMDPWSGTCPWQSESIAKNWEKVLKADLEFSQSFGSHQFVVVARFTRRSDRLAFLKPTLS